MNIILNLLRADGSIIVNKNLAASLGLEAATVYSELLSRYKYFSDRGQLKDGWFFNTIPDLQRGTSLNAYRQRKSIKILVENKLIYKDLRKTKGSDAPKRFFKINEDDSVILRFLSEGGKLFENDNKLLDNDIENLSINNTNINNTNYNNSFSKEKERRFSMKNVDPSFLKIISGICKIFNISMRLPSERKAPTKRYMKTQNYLQSILAGNFVKENNITNGFKLPELQTIEDLDNLLCKALRIREKAIKYKTWSSMPLDLESWLYNPSTGFSWFLKCLSEKPRKLITVKGDELKKSLDLEPAVVKYLENMKGSSWNDLAFWKKVQELKEWHEKVSDDLTYYHIEFWNGYYTCKCQDFSNLIYYYSKFIKTWESFGFGNFGYGNKTWKLFTEWMEENESVKLYLTDEMRQRIRSKKEFQKRKTETESN